MSGFIFKGSIGKILLYLNLIFVGRNAPLKALYEGG
jgi:hypothetical protein